MRILPDYLRKSSQGFFCFNTKFLKGNHRDTEGKRRKVRMKKEDTETTECTEGRGVMILENPPYQRGTKGVVKNYSRS